MSDWGVPADVRITDFCGHPIEDHTDDGCPVADCICRGKPTPVAYHDVTMTLLVETMYVEYHDCGSHKMALRVSLDRGDLEDLLRQLAERGIDVASSTSASS